MKVLIDCKNCTLDDIIFASSIAKKLVEETPDILVDLYVPSVQPSILLTMNPYIHDIFTDYTFNPNEYSRIVQLPRVDQSEPATMQFQRAAGVNVPSVEYKVYTVDVYDEEAERMLEHPRSLGKPVVAWSSNWRTSSYAMSEAQYNAPDREKTLLIPHRNIEGIIQHLNDYVTLVRVEEDGTDNPYTYAMAASIIKLCDFVVGPEGGITNLGAGVGTRCIVTTDNIWRHYGPKGTMRQLEVPAMGPCVYFPKSMHSHLSPFLTDVEVREVVIDIITDAPSVWG
jgi:hypothetical protein